MSQVFWTGATGNGSGTDAANYTPAAPTAGDVLTFADSSRPITRDWDVSSFGTLARVEVLPSYAANWESYLKVLASAAVINSSGGKMAFDFGTVAASILVQATHASGLRLLANKNTTDVFALAGIIDIAKLAGESALLRIAAAGALNASSGPTFTVGAGATCTQVNGFSGATSVNGIVAGVATYGGVTTIDTSYDLDDIQTYGGTCYADRFGSCSQVIISGGFTDFMRTQYPRTIAGSAPNGQIIMQGPGRVRFDPSYLEIVNGLVQQIGRSRLNVARVRAA